MEKYNILGISMESVKFDEYMDRVLKNDKRFLKYENDFVKSINKLDKKQMLDIEAVNVSLTTVAFDIGFKAGFESFKALINSEK